MLFVDVNPHTNFLKLDTACGWLERKRWWCKGGYRLCDCGRTATRTEPSKASLTELNCFCITAWEQEPWIMMGLKEWNSQSEVGEGRDTCRGWTSNMYGGLLSDWWCLWRMGLSSCTVPLGQRCFILCYNHYQGSLQPMATSSLWHSLLLTEQQHRLLLEEMIWSVPRDTIDRKLEGCEGENHYGGCAWAFDLWVDLVQC